MELQKNLGSETTYLKFGYNFYFIAYDNEFYVVLLVCEILLRHKPQHVLKYNYFNLKRITFLFFSFCAELVELNFHNT